MPIVPPSYGQTSGGPGGGGLSRDQVLSLIRGNATEFTFGNAFPGSPPTGALHYITVDNVTIAAKNTDGDAITEGFNGNLFRYDGGDWRFIYNFRSLIEVLIALFSIYVGEYGDNTAYVKNRIVTHNDDIFWTIAAVADTNTTAPASNSSFVQLNGGGDGTSPSSGITASQFLAAMPDYLKVKSASLEPPYFDPSAVHSRYIANIEVINGAFAGTEELVIYFNGIPVETSTNFDSSAPNTVNVDLTANQRRTLGLALAVAGEHAITVGFEFVDASNQTIYLHQIEVPRVSYPLPLGITSLSFSPPFLNPNDLKSRLTAHVAVLPDAFLEATQVRLDLNGIFGDAVALDRSTINKPFTDLNETQLATIKSLLDSITELTATVHFLDSSDDNVFSHTIAIPKADIERGTPATLPSWLSNDDPIPVEDLPNDLRVIDFEFSPPYFDPDEILSEYHAKITTLAGAFPNATHARLRVRGINGDRVAIRGIQATPSISFNATQRETLKTYLQTNSSVDVELDYGTVIGGNFAIGHTISYHFIPRVHIKRHTDYLQTELDNLESEVEQLQTHTGISTLQPTLRLHTPTRGKVMPAVFLEDELFVLESDSNASEEVNRVNMGYRRVDTGGFPAHRDYDGYVSANLGGEMTQTIGSSTSGMFAERRISALYQIDGVKIQLVAPATLFDASSITAETTELRITVRGLDHQIYHLQPDTFVDDDAATRTLNGVVYNVYTTVETPLRSLFESALQAQGPDGMPIGVAVQVVQEVSGVKQFLTGDTAPWATGNIHTAGLYMGDANGLPFEVEIRRKRRVLLAFDESRAYAALALPENYADYNELFMIVERQANAFDIFIPTSALSADITEHGPQNGARFNWSVGTRTVSRVDSPNNARFQRITYAELR